MQTTVLAIGRWMPIHLGHKQFLVNLAKKYDRLVIGIGSCYENGTPRNCIPAIEREKLLRKIFKNEGLDNIIIVPVQDRATFEEWFADVVKLLPMAAVQRLIQALGAFGRLASVGQEGFLKYISNALDNLLAAADEADLDAVGAYAEELISRENYRQGHIPHHHHDDDEEIH